jgi:hypothetical protein
MKNHEREYFCCQDKEGNLIGVERNSGGYPWVPDGLLGIQFWSRQSDAEDYANVLNWKHRRNNSEPIELTVVKVQLVVERV